MSTKALSGSDAPVRRRARPRLGMPRRLLLMAVPGLAFYAFVLVVPSLQGSTFAFTDWNGLDADWSFVGLQNFVEVFTRPASLRALFVTLILAVVVTIVQNALGLAFALGVHARVKSRFALRVILFTPAVLTPIVAAYLWKFILAPDGPLNTVLRSLGLPAVSWLGDPTWALVSIIIVICWQYAGYSMVVFLAGLESIPADILEAAAVDGAGPLRRFWSVTFPLLAPALTINLVLTVIVQMKQFDHVFVLTGGGPGGSTHTISTLIYQDAFQYGKYGTSTALAVVLTLLIAVLSIAQYRGLLRREEAMS